MLKCAAPALYVASLLAKEDRWKRAIEDCWGETSAEEKVSLCGLGSSIARTQAAAAKVAHTILTKALSRWAVRPQTEADFWAKHVNRNVQYHNSLLAWAQKVQLLEKVKSNKGSLNLADGAGLWYSVTSWKKEHVKILTQIHQVGVLLGVLTAPTTTKEWLAAFRLARQLAITAGVGMVQEEYRWPWLVRAWLLVEMNVCGIERLQLDQDGAANRS